MYTFNSKVRYSELDNKGRLGIKSVMAYLQDTSTFQSESLGVGLDYLKGFGQAWVVNYWQVDIFRYPGLGENMTMGTFPYSFKGFLGMRNFFIKDEADEYIVKANSIWTLLDMTKARPAKPDEKQLEAYKVEEKLDMEYTPRKIPVPEKLSKGEPVIVKKEHLDTNDHVNNGQFVAIALDSTDINYDVKRIRAEYRKQAHLGDILIPYIGTSEGGGTVVELQNPEGESIFVVEFS